VAETEASVGALLDGTYLLTGLLGSGGMGTVYLAQHQRLPRRVAVKVLRGAVHGESRERFRREAEIASRLAHPNIVEVLDFNTLPDGTPYIVLEFLEGESLRARLQRGHLALDEAIPIARQIGSALQAAHRMGVVHRDLKPENIFLCPRETEGSSGAWVKVLDFGISKLEGAQTLTRDAQIIGTPEYMAPEQATGQNRNIDARTDQLALGLIVYEMLSGRAPFSGDNLAQIVYRIVFEPETPLAELVPGLPEKVVRSVHRALAKDPAARHPDVGAFIEALSGKPLASPPMATGPAPAAGPATAERAAVASAPTLPSSPVASGITGRGDRPFLPTPTPPLASPLSTVPPGAPVVTGTVPVRRSRAKFALVVLGGLGLLGSAAVIGFHAGEGGGGRGGEGGRGDRRAARTERRARVARVESGASVASIESSPPAGRLTPRGSSPSDAAAPPSGAPDAGHRHARPEPRTPRAKDPHPRTPPPPPVPLGQLPQAARDDLREAEAAFHRGVYDEAIHHAKHSLLAKPTPLAYSLIARSHCSRKEYVQAKAAFVQISPRHMARHVLSYCRRFEIELE
jgi:eukaryotic-like serine/threonine-protein kinase